MMSRLHVHPESHLVDRLGWLRAAVRPMMDRLDGEPYRRRCGGFGQTQRNSYYRSCRTCGRGDVDGRRRICLGQFAVRYGACRSGTRAQGTERECGVRAGRVGSNYVRHGLEHELAVKVAGRLMAKDALGAHARDELGSSGLGTARPVLVRSPRLRPLLLALRCRF